MTRFIGIFAGSPDCFNGPVHEMLRFTPLLLGQVLAVSLYAFDELSVTTIMPVIRTELGGEELYGAVFSAYLLATLLSVIWAGELTDRRGPWLPFLIGIILFALGNLASALAQNMISFVAGRALQGLGGGCLTAVVYASINLQYDEKSRPKVLAYISGAWAIPALVAPGLAAYLAEQFSWRLIFIAIMVLVLITGLLARSSLKALGGNIKTGNKSTSTYALLLVLATGLLLYSLSIRIQWPEVIIALSVLAVMYFSFLKISPGFFSNGSKLSLDITLKFWAFYAFFGLEVFLPLFFVEFYDITILETGLILTAAALGWSLTTFLQAQLATKFSIRTLVMVGLGQLLVAIVVVYFMMVNHWNFNIAYLAWVLAGSGMGLSTNTLVASSMKHTEEGTEGHTSTLNGLCDAMAVAVAAGAGGALINLGLRHSLSRIEVFKYLGAILVIICVINLLLSFFRMSKDEKLAKG